MTTTQIIIIDKDNNEHLIIINKNISYKCIWAATTYKVLLNNKQTLFKLNKEVQDLFINKDKLHTHLVISKELPLKLYNIRLSENKDYNLYLPPCTNTANNCCGHQHNQSANCSIGPAANRYCRYPQDCAGGEYWQQTCGAWGSHWTCYKCKFDCAPKPTPPTPCTTGLCDSINKCCPGWSCNVPPVTKEGSYSCSKDCHRCKNKPDKCCGPTDYSSCPATIVPDNNNVSPNIKVPCYCGEDQLVDGICLPNCKGAGLGNWCNCQMFGIGKYYCCPASAPYCNCDGSRDYAQCCSEKDGKGDCVDIKN